MYSDSCKAACAQPESDVGVDVISQVLREVRSCVDVQVCTDFFMLFTALGVLPFFRLPAGPLVMPVGPLVMPVRSVFITSNRKI